MEPGRFQGMTFLKHFSSEISSLKARVLLRISPLENGSGGGALPLADELTKEVWLAGWGMLGLAGWEGWWKWWQVTLK